MLLYRTEISMFPLFFLFGEEQTVESVSTMCHGTERVNLKYVICLPTEDISFISNFMQFVLSV